MSPVTSANSAKGVLVLFDTDVLIWCFRGSLRASRLVQEDSQRHISVVTWMELAQGARNKAELRSIRDFLSVIMVYIPFSDGL